LNTRQSSYNGSTTFSIMDSIVTLSIMTLVIIIKCRYAECRYAECWVLFVVMLNVLKLSVIVQSVIMLSVGALTIMLRNMHASMFHLYLGLGKENNCILKMPLQKYS